MKIETLLEEIENLDSLERSEWGEGYSAAIRDVLDLIKKGVKSCQQQ